MFSAKVHEIPDASRQAKGVPIINLPGVQVEAGERPMATLCLSKGLGCPLGAVIAGSHELMYRARIEKHRFGGAMRQAGIVAAAGLYALDHNVDRLADDHARARRLGEGWADAGLPVDLELVQTNFVQLDVASLGLAEEDALARIREHGVLLSQTRPGVLRAVTSLEIDDDAIDHALAAVPRALEVVRV